MDPPVELGFHELSARHPEATALGGILEQPLHRGSELAGFVSNQEVTPVYDGEPFARFRRRDHGPRRSEIREDLDSRPASVGERGDADRGIAQDTHEVLHAPGCHDVCAINPGRGVRTNEEEAGVGEVGSEIPRDELRGLPIRPIAEVPDEKHVTRSCRVRKRGDALRRAP